MFNAGGGDDDHLYDFNTNIDSGIAAPGTGFGKAPNTSFKPLTSAGGMNRGIIGTSAGRAPLASRAGLTTGQVGQGNEGRPMTSVSGAGYKGTSKENKAFDPFNIGKGPAGPLAEKSDNSSEDKAKDIEKKVHRLIEESAQALVDKELLKGLEKAKEAGKAERALCKFHDSNNLHDQICDICNRIHSYLIHS